MLKDQTPISVTNEQTSAQPVAVEPPASLGFPAHKCGTQEERDAAAKKAGK